MTETIPERPKPTLHHIILGTHLPPMTAVYFSGLPCQVQRTHERLLSLTVGGGVGGLSRAASRVLHCYRRAFRAGGQVGTRPATTFSSVCEGLETRSSPTESCCGFKSFPSSSSFNAAAGADGGRREGGGVSAVRLTKPADAGASV